MRIIELRAPADETRYKAFFLQGLAEHPAAFRLSPTDEAQEPFPTSGAPDSFTLAAEDEGTGQLLGVVSFRRAEPNRERMRHRGLLFRMYVDHRQKGRGIGRLLIEALLSRVRNLTDVRQINLTVVATNTPARSLYRRLGFVPFALEKEALRLGDAFLDEEHMSLRLA